MLRGFEKNLYMFDKPAAASHLLQWVMINWYSSEVSPKKKKMRSSTLIEDNTLVREWYSLTQRSGYLVWVKIGES